MAANPTKDDDSPSVIGPAAPMPTEAEAREAWKRAYIARWVEKGFDETWGEHWFPEHDLDLTESPQDRADDDMEYLDNE